MAVFKKVPVSEVIMRVLRNTRLQDSSYMDDIVEWIAEAMYAMKSEHALVPKRVKLDVNFHHTRLPSDLDTIEAVVYKGKRLYPNAGGILDAPRSGGSSNTMATVVGSYSPSGSLDSGEDIETVKVFPDPRTFLISYDSLEANREDWYQTTNSNSLEFSIENGEVYLYYWAFELDCDGYLMVPDIEEFKEACYLYVRMKLIESGWEDPVFRYQDIMMKWEQMAPRGANAVAQTTPDEEAKITRNLIRLIVPDNWSTGFALNSNEPII